MSHPIYFEDAGYKVLTSAWAAAALPNTNKVELCYPWKSGFDSKNSTAKTSLNISFDNFSRYIGECMAENKMADLTPDNLPRIANSYNDNPVPMKFGRG